MKVLTPVEEQDIQVTVEIVIGCPEPITGIWNICETFMNEGIDYWYPLDSSGFIRVNENGTYELANSKGIKI